MFDMGDFAIWFEIWLLFQSPRKFLGSPIRVIGDDGVKEGAYGAFKVPYSYTVSVMDVLLSHAWDLVGYCFEIDRGCPNLFVFLPKVGVRTTDDGWVVLFGPDCAILEKNDIDLA